MGTVSSLAGGILSLLVDPPPGQESVVTKVVTDVVGKLLHEQTTDELKALFRGKEKAMQMRLEALKTMSQSGLRNNLTLLPVHRDVFVNGLMDFLEDGVELSERILFYIDRDSNTDIRSKADEVVLLQTCWGKLATLRMQLLTHMASLLGMRGGDEHLQEIVRQELQNLNKTILSTMKFDASAISGSQDYTICRCPGQKSRKLGACP